PQNRLHLSIHEETAWGANMHRLRSKSCGSLNKENYFAETGRGLPLQNHVRVPLQASIARRLSDRESEKRSQGGDNGNGTTPPLPPRRTPSPRPSGASGVVQQSGASVRTRMMLGTGGQHLSDQGATGAVAPSVQSSSAAAASGAGALPLVQFFGSGRGLLQPPHLCRECNIVETAVGALMLTRERRRAAAREAADRIAALELRHSNLVDSFRRGSLGLGVQAGSVLESHRALRQARQDALQEAKAFQEEEASLQDFIDASYHERERQEHRSHDLHKRRLRNQLAEYALLRAEAALERQRQAATLQRRLMDVLSQALVAEGEEDIRRIRYEEETIRRQLQDLDEERTNPHRGRRKPA
ncbi:hypothetical protein TGRUB_434270, partial [Toxoplasma gondii RUB]